MADEHGTGAIQSPPDERDLVLDEPKAALLASGLILPHTYRLPTRPPITDQGLTPQCVAYSTAYEQNWQDRQEHGRFFDFNEARHFEAIGGTSAGAVMRYSLDRLVDHGYPEQDSTPSAFRHQADSYARVTQTVAAIKTAIIKCGGVLVVGPWYESWSIRTGSLQVLGRPWGASSGHAWWGIGWDDYGLIGQQTWGKLWGDEGLFRMPWEYVVNSMWEVWTTLDEKTVQVVAKARIKELQTNLRKPRLVIGENPGPLDHRSIWGETRRAGIWRRSTDSIVTEPWDKPFRYFGKKHGAHHGIGDRPETWALLGIAGNRIAVPIPKVRLV